MALILNEIASGYNYIFTEIADPRAKDYPLVASPLPLAAIVTTYLYFVLKLGPKLMANRKPFKLDKIIIAFNIAQIIACSFLVIKFIQYAFFTYSWRCEPIDYSDKPVPMLIVFYAWVYFIVKLFDLLDTVFFVLRKKFNQISFLHVYHHTGMAIMMWVGAKYVAGGTGLFLGFANSIVHVCMYFYYLISVWDEKYKKSVWWKKHITQLQMAQFLFLVVLFGQVLIQPGCTYPKWIAILFLPQNVFMLMLFADFYRKAYLQKKPEIVHQNGETSGINKTELKKQT